MVILPVCVVFQQTTARFVILYVKLLHLFILKTLILTHILCYKREFLFQDVPDGVYLNVVRIVSILSAHLPSHETS